MRKQDLLAALEHRLDAHVYALLSPTFVPDSQWARLTSARPASAEAAASAPMRADAVSVARRLADPQGRAVLVDLHREALKRSLLLDAHDMISVYAERSGQVATYEAAEWFPFARVLRGVLSARSGGVLRAWPDDAPPLVHWRNRRLARDMVGDVVPFSLTDALVLFRDHVDFVREALA